MGIILVVLLVLYHGTNPEVSDACFLLAYTNTESPAAPVKDSGATGEGPSCRHKIEDYIAIQWGTQC